MAQAKHTFVESKMNKDLDDRLLSGGQYRDALNIAVSKSEDSDVGALENVLGNELISTLFPNGATIPTNLQCIGGYTSNEKNSVYLFLTNYCDTSFDQQKSPATANATCLIAEYNIKTKTSNILVEGSFLNFSTGNYITGINIIEDLLFWTDNRNQPRKINIETARAYFQTQPYYTNEDQVSVAKYAPVLPIKILEKRTINNVFWEDYDWLPWPDTSPTETIAATVFYQAGNTDWPRLNDYKKYDQINIVGEDKPLYIADFRYSSTTGNKNGIIVWRRLSNQSTQIGKEIRLFKNNAVDATSKFLPPSARIELRNDDSQAVLFSAGDSIAFSPTGNTKAFWMSPRVDWQLFGNDLQSGGTNLDPAMYVGCGVFSSVINENLEDVNGNRLNGINFVVNGATLDSFRLQQNFTLFAGQSVFFDLCLPNPQYQDNFAGDKENLKDKFVRFAYRFKFDDNEYSLLSPFTQPVFIPEQDGYMLNRIGAFNSGLTDSMVNQQSEAGTETVLKWFENKVNQIKFSIPLEFQANELFDKLKVKEIQIIYKESDALALKVVEDIDTTSSNLSVVNNSTNTITYNYQSGKPFKTLPEKVITRVSDKVPLKALAQETSGNRVIYGNFVDKHTSPLTLDYLVNSGTKFGPNDLGTIDSFVEYPNHTLKQNRTYQVGIILQDRYGRQSDVILADPLEGGKIEAPAGSGNFYGDSTIYHAYKPDQFNGSSEVLEWFGDSLKVFFRNVIPETIADREGYPGLYSPDNPTGWYSYKIVVKQKQQDYYNVYLPSLLYGVPLGGSISVDWNRRNVTGGAANCGAETTNEVFVGSNTLTGLSTTDGLRAGMKFVLKSGSYQTGTNANLPPNSPAVFQCGSTGVTCDSYEIVDILDDTTIEFSPIAAQTYYPFCDNTPTPIPVPIQPGDVSDNSCCAKNPWIFNVNTSSAISTAPAPSVANSQPTQALLFQDSGQAIITTASVSSPDEMTTTLLTDNVNKVPADLSDVRPNQNQFSTSDKIFYPRVAMQQADKFFIPDSQEKPRPGTTLVYPSQIDTITEYDVVKFMSDWNDTFTTNKRTGLYKTNTNPFTAIFSNTFQIGSGSSEPQTFSVIETEPTISELDIFWETTTSGLISELNDLIVSQNDVAGVGGASEFFQPENLEPSSTSPAVVGKVFAVDGAGQTVSSNITLISVIDGNGVNLTSDYNVVQVPNTNEYNIEATTPVVFIEQASSNQRVFLFEVEDTQIGSNNLTNYYTYSVAITNFFPQFQGFPLIDGNGGYPNNPTGEVINIVDNSSTVVLGKYAVASQGNSSPIDRRVYIKNGSGAEFFIQGLTVNEWSETTLDLEVSNCDLTSTSTNPNFQQEFNSCIVSSDQITVTSTVFQSKTGTSTTVNSVVTVYDGFYIQPGGLSSPTLTPTSYNIPDGVDSFQVAFNPTWYRSSDPDLVDAFGQPKINPDTNQPYFLSGFQAMQQDAATIRPGRTEPWLASRYIKLIARDANGSALSLRSDVESNITNQEGIRIDFGVPITQANGLIEGYYTSGFVGADGYNPLFDIDNTDLSNLSYWCCNQGTNSISTASSDTAPSSQVLSVISPFSPTNPGPPPGNACGGIPPSTAFAQHPDRQGGNGSIISM
tara:strand:- start:458 stop:5293 length:4836 start_codon:yes stop_codon:yes gene_type:complete